jgi:hypothetical protein
MAMKIRAVRNIITGSALVVAAGLGTAGVASAATTHVASTTHVSARTSSPAGAPLGNPADLTHGPGETLLTGSTLTSAVAAAEAAVPGATVVRAETDSSGSPYEVHMLKADGTYVTVKLNDSFTVTAIEKGFGKPPAGTHPVGAPPAGSMAAGFAPGERPDGPPPTSAASAAA